MIFVEKYLFLLCEIQTKFTIHWDQDKSSPNRQEKSTSRVGILVKISDKSKWCRAFRLYSKVFATCHFHKNCVDGISLRITTIQIGYLSFQFVWEIIKIEKLSKLKIMKSRKTDWDIRNIDKILSMHNSRKNDTLRKLHR